MALWIDYTFVRGVYPISDTHGDNIDFNVFIQMAQYSDVQRLIGRELYNDIIADPTATTNGNYPKLLNGHSYTFDSKTYEQPGLKTVTAWFALARYAKNRNKQDTAFGFSRFEAEKIMSLSKGEADTDADDFRRFAQDYWNEVQFFLNSQQNTTSAYTHWSSGDARTLSNDGIEVEFDSF